MHEVEAGLDAGLALRERRLAHRLLLMSTAGQSCGFVQIGQVKIPAAGVNMVLAPALRCSADSKDPRSVSTWNPSQTNSSPCMNASRFEIASRAFRASRNAATPALYGRATRRRTR